MRLRQFRVRGFRCVRDSGPVDVGDIAALVGKNESGKTALLEALLHLNKGKEFNELDICDEMQIAGDIDDSTVIVEGLFELLPHEIKTLQEECLDCPEIKKLRIGRKYGTKQVFYDFPGAEFGQRIDIVEKVQEQYLSRLDNLRAGVQGHFSASGSAEDEVNSVAVAEIEQVLASLQIVQDKTTAALEAAIHQLADLLRRSLPKVDFASPIEELKKAASGLYEQVDVKEEVTHVIWESFHPKFVYFSEYKKIYGLVHVPTYLQAATAPERQKLDTGELLDKRETVRNLFHLADLNPQYLEQVKANPSLSNKYLRHCSAKITQALAWTWKTQRIEIEFDYAVGDLLSVIVSDVQADGSRTNSGPLSRRSEGFRWHFSFYINFIAETQKEELKEAILLLDEPGLHLHPAQQVGMLDVLRDLATSNQILYTTHSPYLIYDYKLGAVLTVELDPIKHLSRITPRLWKGDLETIAPILSVLGTSITAAIHEPSLIPYSPPTVIVEGETDLMYLIAMERVVQGRRDKSFGLRVNYQNANGSPNVSPFAMFFFEKGFPTLALYDKEPSAAGHLVTLKEQGFPEENILSVVVDEKKECDIEDLFTEADYLKGVNGFYTAHLRDQKFSIITKEDMTAVRKKNPSLIRTVPTLEAVWEEHRDEGWGKFDKKKVCSKICEIASKDKKFPTEKTLQQFETLLEQIYQRAEKIRQSAEQSAATAQTE